MTPRVRKDGDRTWIDGVKPMEEWGGGRECTFVEALSTAMLAIGEDADYDYLMGVSGMAFRLQMREPDWCASAPDAGCGFDATRTAWEALGYGWHSRVTDETKPESRLKTREAIVDSIDDGFPVLAMDLEDGMDWGVIAGYADGGRTLLCRTKESRSDCYSGNKKWPWLTNFIDRKKSDPDRRVNYVRSLDLAVELAGTTEYGGFTSGYAAYNMWINHLADDRFFDGIDPGRLRELTQPNAWCFYSLYDARASAARYLGALRDEFASISTAGNHLSAATEIYGRIAQVLGDGQRNAPFPSQLGEGLWTRGMRHEQAGVLAAVLALEKEAVFELQAALTSLL
jgi:hypothetical protein